MPDTQRVTDLKIADYSVEVDEADALNPDKMDIQKAYLQAMQKEKAAFKMYNDLAGMTDDQQCREVLLSLAQEEARHKLYLEIEYDDQFFSEN